MPKGSQGTIEAPLVQRPQPLKQFLRWSRELWTDARATPDLCGPDGIKKNNFDLMRFCMATLVIFSHSYPIAKGTTFISRDKPMFSEPLMRLTNGTDTLGGIAVNVFFIISGFLIAMSYERSKGVEDYLRRRILRIYPGFIAVSLFCGTVIAGLYTVAPFEGVTASLLLNCVLNSLVLQEHWVPGVFLKNPEANAINGSLWSIRFEFGCYLLILALGAVGLLKRRGLLTLVFVGIFAAMVYQRWFQLGYPENVFALVHGWTDIPREVYDVVNRYMGPIQQWPGVMVYFLAGTLCYLWRDRIPQRFSLFLLAATIYSTVLLGTMGSDYLRYYSTYAVAIVAPLTLTYCVLWIGFQPYLRFPGFAKYGDFSYGMYLYAFPIQQAVKAAMGPSFRSAFVLFCIATPITLLFAMASWHFIEKPFLRKKHVRPSERTGSGATAAAAA